METVFVASISIQQPQCTYTFLPSTQRVVMSTSIIYCIHKVLVIFPIITYPNRFCVFLSLPYTLLCVHIILHFVQPTITRTDVNVERKSLFMFLFRWLGNIRMNKKRVQSIFLSLLSQLENGPPHEFCTMKIFLLLFRVYYIILQPVSISPPNTVERVVDTHHRYTQDIYFIIHRHTKIGKFYYIS